MLCLSFAVALLVAAFGQTYPNFNDSDIATMRGYFETNIGVTAGYQNRNPVTGCLIASPAQVDRLVTKIKYIVDMTVIISFFFVCK